jgi:hypothetical protein
VIWAGVRAAELAVDVELQGRIGVEPDLAGGQERGVGQRPARAGDRLAHRDEGEAQPVGVAEPVHHQLPGDQAGVLGDGPARVMAAVGDFELMGDKLVHRVVQGGSFTIWIRRVAAERWRSSATR